MHTNLAAAAIIVAAMTGLLSATAGASGEGNVQPPAGMAAAPVMAERIDGGWLDARVVDERQLAAQRGGAELHLNQNNASAAVHDNTASNLSTGNNTISGSAFANTNGVPMVVQNSGNNVVIQNSTILNLQMQ